MFIRCTEKRCDGNFFNPIRFPSFVENIFLGTDEKRKKRNEEKKFLKKKLRSYVFFLFQIFTSLEKKKKENSK